MESIWEFLKLTVTIFGYFVLGITYMIVITGVCAGVGYLVFGVYGAFVGIFPGLTLAVSSFMAVGR